MCVCVSLCSLPMRLSKSLNLSLDTTKLATMATMSRTNPPPLLLLLAGLVLVPELGQMAELDNKIKQTLRERERGRQATVVKSDEIVCLILRREVTTMTMTIVDDDCQARQCYHTHTHIT